tara:strand:+ start:1019 stop:1210 length:192 start_codon:yes stop_codon:yes gene_type:complete
MRQVSPYKIEIVRRGLVQADVARAMTISESRLSRILNGRIEPSGKEKLALEQMLPYLTGQGLP